MKLNLQELKSAMAPLSEIGKGELAFDVNGLMLVLRALTPEEEIHVQRYARQALADGDLTDQTNALEYLDRFRICSLGYSLVQAGDIDFRGVEFIETGDKLPNGTMIRVRKHEAVMQLVSAWSRNMVNAVFKKFGELQNRVEKEVEGLIEFDEVDYDAEIARLEDRVRELKEAKVKADLSTKDPRSDIRKRIAASNKTISTTGSNPASGAPVDPQFNAGTEYDVVAIPSEVDREVEDDTPDDDDEDDDGSLLYDDSADEEKGNQPIRPQDATPGGRSSLFDRVRGVAAPPQRKSENQSAKPQEVPVPQDNPSDQPSSFDDVQHSFVDANDPDVMKRAVAEENRRLMAQRAARSAAPHLAAKRVADNLSVSQPTLSGQMGGMEVYKMPTQTMTDRKVPTTKVEAASPKSTSNPKFRPIR